MALVNIQDVSHIFRSYDIRGIYGNDLNEDIMEKIGNNFGNYCKKDVVIGRDARIHSKSLRDAFVLGAIKSGCDVFDVGKVSLGIGMFYAWKNGKEFAYITGSHLGKEWNGVKFFHADGMGYLEDENYKIRDMFLEGKISMGKKIGKVHTIDTSRVVDNYRNFLSSKIRAARKIKVILDPGNGMAGLVAKALFQNSGFIASAIFEEVDCTFPNRNPEPQVDELTELKNKIKEERADIGIAFDGDGDRIVLVDNLGRKLTPEQTAYLILKEAVNKKGPIVANVECTRLIDNIAKKFGKSVIRFPVGHTFLVNTAKKTNACFGIEVSGHYVLPFIFPFDDSMAVALYAAYVLSKTNKPLSAIVDEIKPYPFERTKFDVDDKKKFVVMKSLKEKLSREYKNISTMDGIRIDFDNGFVLIRASNTSPIIRLTVEGNTEKDFTELMEKFTSVLAEEIKK
jgi:phosphomannomutase